MAKNSSFIMPTETNPNTDSTAQAPQTPRPDVPKRIFGYFVTALRVVVLAASVLLVVLLSIDALNNRSFLTDPRYLHYQFWICLLFLADIIVSFFASSHKLRYALLHLGFFLICIPWLNILHWLQVNITGELHYLLRILPIFRVAYIVGSMAGGVNRSRIRGMFAAYVTLLLTVTYLASVMFFVEEHGINPAVTSYWSALYWTILNLTTVGCDIIEYSLVGKILAVFLSALGLILFPVFTVYVASLVAPTQADS